MALIERPVTEARALDELDPATEPEQLAFELNAMLVGANSSYLLQQGNPAVLERARRAIQRLLDPRP